jgi:phage terminase large subunit-like protein
LVDTALSTKWLEQLMSFPASGHDDAVDATVAGLYRFQTHANNIVTDDFLDAVTKR